MKKNQTIPAQTKPAPAPNPVETLLTFIEANASEEVFEKAQELETLLSDEAHSYKSEVEEYKQKLTDLKEELTDGDNLAEYARKLSRTNTGYFVDAMMGETAFKSAAEDCLSDRLMDDNTRYLAIPLTNDAMDAILHDKLAERIAALGVEESLRLLQGF